MDEPKRDPHQADTKADHEQPSTPTSAPVVTPDHNTEVPGGGSDAASGDPNLTNPTGLSNRFLRDLEISDWITATATVAIAIMTYFYVTYAHGQLRVMQGTLDEMKRSGQSTTDQMWRAIDNMNWQARTMDGALKQTQVAVDKQERQNSAALKAGISQGKAVIDSAIQSLEWSQRPWITEDATISDPVTFDVNGMRFTLLFTLENIGHSPAESVWVHGGLVNMLYGAAHDPSADQRQFCESTNKGIGATVFPGKAWRYKMTWYIPWEQIRNSRTTKIIAPALYGCVQYRFGLSAEQHYTPFRYSIMQSDGRALVSDAEFSIASKEIPVSQLVLRSEGWFFGQRSPN